MQSYAKIMENKQISVEKSNKIVINSSVCDVVPVWKADRHHCNNYNRRLISLRKLTKSKCTSSRNRFFSYRYNPWCEYISNNDVYVFSVETNKKNVMITDNMKVRGVSRSCMLELAPRKPIFFHHNFKMLLATLNMSI